MPPKPNEGKRPRSPARVARRLARALDKRGTEYAIGGAIALGFWAQPRGTMDVDLTLFIPSERASEAIWELQEIGCDLSASKALASLREHGFCRVTYAGWQVDVFVPTNAFYEHAKARRRKVHLGNQEVVVLDAETLAVFKMMFFRPRDMADIHDLLRVQGATFDRDWVRARLLDIVGQFDPRIVQWDELVAEANQ